MTDRNQVVVECDKCGEVIGCPEKRVIPYGTLEAVGWQAKYMSEIRWIWRVPDLCQECMEEARRLLVDNGFAVQGG